MHGLYKDPSNRLSSLNRTGEMPNNLLFTYDTHPYPHTPAPRHNVFLSTLPVCCRCPSQTSSLSQMIPNKDLLFGIKLRLLNWISWVLLKIRISRQHGIIPVISTHTDASNNICYATALLLQSWFITESNILYTLAVCNNGQPTTSTVMFVFLFQYFWLTFVLHFSTTLLFCIVILTAIKNTFQNLHIQFFFRPLWVISNISFNMDTYSRLRLR